MNHDMSCLITISQYFFSLPLPLLESCVVNFSYLYTGPIVHFSSHIQTISTLFPTCFHSLKPLQHCLEYILISNHISPSIQTNLSQCLYLHHLHFFNLRVLNWPALCLIQHSWSIHHSIKACL